MRDDHELGPILGQIRVRDLAALSALLAKIRPYLHLLVRQRLDLGMRGVLGDSDIVQETLMRIHKGLDPDCRNADAHFDGQNVPQFLNWVGQIVRNVIIDMDRRVGAQVRDKAREVPGSKVFPLLARGTTPGQRIEHAKDSVRLAEALARLPQHHQDVLHWRFFEQLSFEEISRRTGKTVGALRVVCTRALGRLAQDARLRQAMEAIS